MSACVHVGVRASTAAGSRVRGPVCPRQPQSTGEPVSAGRAQVGLVPGEQVSAQERGAEWVCRRQLRLRGHLCHPGGAGGTGRLGYGSRKVLASRLPARVRDGPHSNRSGAAALGLYIRARRPAQPAARQAQRPSPALRDPPCVYVRSP